MKNKIIIENGDKADKYDVLLNVDVGDNNYIIYTKREENEYGDIIAYAGDYRFVDGVQFIKPIEDEEIYVEFGSSLSPSIIKSVEDTGDYVYMILPIRIQE